MKWLFEHILIEEQWQQNVRIETDAQGRIVKLEPDSQETATERVKGFAFPGFHNAHSHAFQHAMAGLAENLSPHQQADDFWAWRQNMYRLALEITPDEMETVARQLYSQMLRAGYTWVAEFHYLHHDPNGRPYSPPHEMALRLLKAADQVGIGITLIPILYQRCDFENLAKPEQRRFLSKSVEDYNKLLEACQKSCLSSRQNVAAGIHSLRAVDDASLDFFSDLRDMPIHIHISEQVAEVEQCLATKGRRPVQWLFDKLPIDENWHLVHATHIDDSEIDLITQSKVHVVLCPSTEGNLGDGFFPLREYLKKQGRWSIGSDSHVTLNPLEELRWLDYGQRMLLKKRNVICQTPGDDSGHIALHQAMQSGARAVGSAAGFVVGGHLDAVVVKDSAPLWRDLPVERRCSALIYASSPLDFQGTIAGGKWSGAENSTKQRQSHTL